MPGDDPRHLAFRRDDYRRLVVRAVAQDRHRVFVLPGNADHGRRRGVLRLRFPPSVPDGGLAGDRPGLRDLLCFRDDRRARFAEIHRQPYLCGVRLVPDCLRPGDPGHLAVRLGRLVEPLMRTPRSQEQTRQVATRVQHLKLKLALLLVLCVLPGFGALKMWLGGGSALPLWVYGIASLLAFFLYWSDKRKARDEVWRTPEKVLHAIELLG